MPIECPAETGRGILAPGEVRSLRVPAGVQHKEEQRKPSAEWGFTEGITRILPRDCYQGGREKDPQIPVHLWFDGRH